MYESIKQIKTVGKYPGDDKHINNLLEQGWTILEVKVGQSSDVTDSGEARLRAVVIWILGKK